MRLKISKTQHVRGTITVPGDKSISHRALMIGAIANGSTEVSGFLPSEDCISTLNCLTELGVRIDRNTETTLTIHGSGLKGLREPSNILDVGNSGTTLRILPGIIAGQDIFAVLTGDESIRKRPASRIAEPLCLMGASIWGREHGKFAPIAVQGSALNAIDYKMNVASAQVKTCLMLAALYAKGETKITEPAKSRDHTERMLELFGVRIKTDENTYSIKGGQKLKASDIEIPGDISSAAFFIVAGIITPESEMVIENVGINETRTGIIDVLKRMGAKIDIESANTKSNEPRANIKVSTSELRGVRIEGDIVPRLIDEIPIIAVAATQAKGETIIRNAAELRVKESDRIEALAIELRKMGAKIDELEDGMIIKGPTPLKGTFVDGHNDHRIAMSLAIAGLIASRTTTILESECINISYPEFEQTLAQVSG